MRGGLMIFGIKPFEIHDGDGIRTTIFFKGCLLRCKWCHNPESFTFDKQLFFDVNKCINCGKCSLVCDSHKMIEGKHILDRSTCMVCGKCVKMCDAEALKIYGEEMTVDEIVKIVEKDEIFLKECNGGVTLSGGEPLMQPKLCQELLKTFKEKGYNTAVDTCCYVNTDIISKIIPFVDTFLIDIKAIDRDTHIKCTGVDNDIILKNIKFIDESNKNIEIRYPFIPGMNDGEVEAIGTFVKELKNVVKMKVLPYHCYGKTKYAGLDIDYPGETIPIPANEQLENVTSILKAMKICVYSD